MTYCGCSGVHQAEAYVSYRIGPLCDAIVSLTQSDAYNFGNAYEEGLASLGDELRDAKKFNEAIQFLELKVEESPSSWWAYDRLGQAYMEAGKKDLAIKSFRKSLQLDPAQAYAAFKLKQLNSH